MNRITLTLISVAALALGCDGNTDQLSGGGGMRSRDPNRTAGGDDSTYNHSNDPGAADPGADYQPPPPPPPGIASSPEVAARTHSCGKMTVTSIGHLLYSRGLMGRGGGRPNGGRSGLQLYGSVPQDQTIPVASNATAATLGGPNYNGRVAEAAFASTSAMSKLFDIFAMAAYDAVANNWEAPACPGVKVLGADGKFTKDGITCLMGKPATDEHVALANDAIEKNPTDGAKIAIAALLAAAHTCQ